MATVKLGSSQGQVAQHDDNDGVIERDTRGKSIDARRKRITE
jgi:hypothetical protein